MFSYQLLYCLLLLPSITQYYSLPLLILLVFLAYHHNLIASQTTPCILRKFQVRFSCKPGKGRHEVILYAIQPCQPILLQSIFVRIFRVATCIYWHVLEGCYQALYLSHSIKLLWRKYLHVPKEVSPS